MYCIKCGSPLKEDQRFCVKCGTAVPAGDADPMGAIAADVPMARTGNQDETVALEPSRETVAIAAGLATDEEVPKGTGAEPAGEALGEESSNGLATDEDIPEESATGLATDEDAPAPPAHAAPATVPSGIDVMVSDDEPGMRATGDETMPLATAETAAMHPQPPVGRQVPLPSETMVMGRPPAPSSLPRAETGQAPRGGYNASATYGAAVAAEPQTGRTSKIAAIVLSILAVAAVIAVVLVVGMGMGPGRTPAEADEPTECTMITRIYPADDDGDPLQNYTVRILDRLTGKEVAKLDVTNGSGFTPEELGLDPGKYNMEITDGDTGETREYNPINVEPDNPKAPDTGKVTPTPTPAPAPSSGSNAKTGDGSSAQEGGDKSQNGSAGGNVSEGSSSPSVNSPAPSDSSSVSNSSDPSKVEKARAKAYLKVVEDLVDKYGDGALREMSGGVTMLEGVCFAKLVDFDNDGTEELLVAYFDKDKADTKTFDDMNDPRAYIAQIWTYDGKNAKKIYEHATDSSNGGFAFLRLYRNGDESFLAPIAFQNHGNSTDMVTEVAKVSKGKADKTEFAVRDSYSSSPTYEIDGTEASEEDYKKALEAATKSTSTENYALSMTSSTSPVDSTVKSYTTKETLETMEKAIESLNKLAGNASSSKSPSKQSGLTEKQAKEILDKNGYDDVLYLFVEDFDNDGTTEAFAVTGKPTANQDMYDDGSLVFISSDGDAYNPDFGNSREKTIGNQMNGLVKSDEGYIFLSTEHNAFGSGTSSTVFSVKDGSPVLIKFDMSDTVGAFQNDGGLTGYISVFPEGKGHQYEWHAFKYDYATSTMKDQGVTKTTGM